MKVSTAWIASSRAWMLARAARAIVRIRAALAESAWAALAGKGGLLVTGFALLALVGSGRVPWLSASGTRRIGVAEAAAAPLPSASVVAAVPSSVPVAAKVEVDAGAPAPDSAAMSGGVAADGKIILNRATEEDLRRLPGIGATRAKAILALRTRLGRFTRPEDLLKVKGIGRRSLARLRPLLSVD